MTREKLAPWLNVLFGMYLLWFITFCCLNDQEMSIPICVGILSFSFSLLTVCLYKILSIFRWMHLCLIVTVFTLLHIVELIRVCEFLLDPNLGFGEFTTWTLELRVLYVLNVLQTIVILIFLIVYYLRDW